MRSTSLAAIQPAQDLPHRLAHVWVLVVELDVVVGLEPGELLVAACRVVHALGELRPQEQVHGPVEDQQRRRCEERRVGDRVVGEVRRQRLRGDAVLPRRGVVARRAGVVAERLRIGHERESTREVGSSRRDVLDLAGLVLAGDEVVDLADELGEPIGPEIGQERATDIEAAGDARDGRDALVPRRGRDRVAASHADAHERDTAAVDVVAADQVADRVCVVADDLRWVVVAAWLALALAVRPRVERQHRVARVGEALRVVGQRLLLDAARRSAHRDRGGAVGGARAGRAVEMARERQPVAVEADVLPSRRVGDQDAVGRRVNSSGDGSDHRRS
jgi:hypothetical protein